MALKVSVITTTFNDCENLKKIISRVAKQDYPNLEYIIVDGGSSDNTVEIIKEAEQLFVNGITWISEPDKGIYDAINKGIKLATGDIVGVMFDEFADNTILSQMINKIEETGADGVHGDINYVDENGRIIRKWRMGQGALRTGHMPGHPTLYLKKDVYKRFGLYKTEYKIAADYEFMIRIITKETKLAYIPKVLVNMFYGGNSTSTGGLKNYIDSLIEGHRALKENGIKFAFVTDILRTFRVLFQFVR